MNRTLYVWLPNPSLMHLGDSKAERPLQGCEQVDLSPGLLPDLLYNPASNELVGVFFALASGSFTGEGRHLAAAWDSSITRFNSMPSTFAEFGSGEILSVQWAKSRELRGVVGHLVESCFYRVTKPGRSLKPGRDIVALAIHGFDDTLDSHGLFEARTAAIPLVSASDWINTVGDRLASRVHSNFR